MPYSLSFELELLRCPAAIALFEQKHVKKWQFADSCLLVQDHVSTIPTFSENSYS